MTDYQPATSRAQGRTSGTVIETYELTRRLPEPYQSAIWRTLYLPFGQWRFSAFLRNFTSERGDGETDPTTIDRGNASLLLETFETEITDLRSKIANLEVHAAGYDNLISTLQIPNAPWSLKTVLPLARMIRKVRVLFLGG